MLRGELLRDHVDALKRLASVSKEPAVAARLAQLADELRIIISVADVADLAASPPAPLRRKGRPPLRLVPPDLAVVERSVFPWLKAANQR